MVITIIMITAMIIMIIIIILKQYIIYKYIYIIHIINLHEPKPHIFSHPRFGNASRLQEETGKS